MTLSSENNLVRKIVKFWVSWKTSQLANLWLKLWLFMFVAKKFKQFGFLNDSSLNQNSFSDFHKHKLLLSTEKKKTSEWVSVIPLLGPLLVIYHLKREGWMAGVREVKVGWWRSIPPVFDFIPPKSHHEL